ncbi:hypothetical protein FKM82_030706 [Ascaphus truei]
MEISHYSSEIIYPRPITAANGLHSLVAAFAATRVLSPRESELCFSFCTEFSVQGPTEQVRVLRGQTVVLGCSVSPVPPLNDIEVEWIQEGTNNLLLLYSEGQDRPESQSYTYRGRAEFYGDKQQGDFSLQLQQATEKDEGRYRCMVSYKGETKEAAVDLKIKGISLQSSSLHTSVTVGEAVDTYVLLHCIMTPRVPLDHLEVKWVLREKDVDQVVHLFTGEADRPDDQYFLYRDRTELFPEEISKGNLSLRLKVRYTDSGTYSCTVRYGLDSASSEMELYVSCKYDEDKFKGDNLLYKLVHAFCIRCMKQVICVSSI